LHNSAYYIELFLPFMFDPTLSLRNGEAVGELKRRNGWEVIATDWRPAFLRKRGTLMRMDRDGIIELVKAVSIHSPERAKELRTWLEQVHFRF
jgi:hypothetical protein